MPTPRPARSLLAMLTALAVALVPASVAAAATPAIEAWGDNSGGELGDGTLTQSDAPVAVSGLGTVSALAAGDRFNLALLPSGAVETWGENEYGQLGNGTTTTAAVPAPVSGLSGVAAIAAGGGHALALLSDGTVMTWGDNRSGQLGDGAGPPMRPTPAAVSGLSGVTAIAAGELDSYALLANGTVMAWGDNRDGQLGDGTLTNSDVPVAVSGLSHVTALAAGEFFSLALLSDGTVMAWGDGTDGELGNGTFGGSDVPVAVSDLAHVAQISAGNQHALAALSSGAVKAWGSNAFNQLGVNTGLNDDSDVPVAVTGLSHVRAVAAGGLSSLALLASGTVEAWGDNALGQLGTGTTNDATAPTAVPGLSGVSAIASGTVHALAVVAGGAGGARASAPLTPWSVVATPNPGAPAPPAISDVFFTAVSASGPSDAWAVGESGLFDGRPMSEHWNGSAWKPVAMAAVSGAVATIEGVVDLGAGDAWAVGWTTSSSDQEMTLVEHWDGTAWQVVPSPDPDGGSEGNDALQAIAAVSPTDIWAAGQDFFNAEGQPITMLFEHWNGTAWTAAPSPPPNGDDFSRAITMLSPTDGWAVGTNTFETTLAAHWNGKRWSIVPTPSPQDGPAPGNVLTGVSAVAAGDVWASGYEDNVDGENFLEPYLLHWTGGSWSLVNAPNQGTEGSMLSGVAALSAGDVWAVGQTQETDGSILALTERYDGTAWTAVPSPDPGEFGPLIDDSLAAVASAGGGTIWALGAQETLDDCCLRTLALRTSSG